MPSALMVFSSIRSLRQRARRTAWTGRPAGGFEIDDKNNFGRLFNREA